MVTGGARGLGEEFSRAFLQAGSTSLAIIDLKEEEAAATAKDCQDAVEVAARAFKTWENSPLSVRRDVFLKASELLNTDKWKKRVTEALQQEVSATDFMVIFNFFLSTNGLRVDAGAIDQLKGETYVSMLPGGQVTTQRRAMGVM